MPDVDLLITQGFSAENPYGNPYVRLQAGDQGGQDLGPLPLTPLPHHSVTGEGKIVGSGTVLHPVIPDEVDPRHCRQQRHSGRDDTANT